jgi:23S rRNA (cytidine1920-2'-O)/16S rRNA (cytidine1409-2'-O)-methyltransferase
MTASENRYVSRGGLKLQAALSAFELDVTGLTCVDLGSHVGGFVDCLLQHGARRVYAVDPGRGALDSRLRNDARVIACEGINALKYVCPEPCDLATIDVGWTPQRLVLPAARRMLKPQTGRAISLIKPQYEAPPDWLRGGVLPPERLDAVLDATRTDVRELGWGITREIESPIPGHGGNLERLWLIKPD